MSEAEREQVGSGKNVVDIDDYREPKPQVNEPQLPIKMAKEIKSILGNGVTSLSPRAIRQAMISFVSHFTATNCEVGVKATLAVGAVSATSEQNQPITVNLKRLLTTLNADYFNQLTKEYIELHYSENNEFPHSLFYIPQNLSSEMSIASKQTSGSIKACHGIISELFDNNNVHFKVRKTAFTVKEPLINIFSTFAESDIYNHAKQSMQGKGLFSIFINAYCDDHQYNDFVLSQQNEIVYVKALKTHIDSLTIKQRDNFNFSKYKRELYDFCLKGNKINVNRIIQNFTQLVYVLSVWNKEDVDDTLCQKCVEFIKFHAMSMANITAKKASDDLNDSYDSVCSFLETPKSDRELVHACRAYRNLSAQDRNTLIDTMMTDGVITLIPKSTNVDADGFPSANGKPSRGMRYMLV